MRFPVIDLMLYCILILIVSSDEDAATGDADAPDRSNSKRRKDTENDGKLAAELMLATGESDICNWGETTILNPLSFIKGEVCGGYYKILGLDRNEIKEKVDVKKEVKRAFRQRSLAVHPDKNSSPEAKLAFKLLQEAYDCLSDTDCIAEYENKLIAKEIGIRTGRALLKEKIVTKVSEAMHITHHYVSIAASNIYIWGTEVFRALGDLEIEMLGSNYRSFQAIVLMILGFSKARILLKIFSLSYVINRLNSELAKREYLF